MNISFFYFDKVERGFSMLLSFLRCLYKQFEGSMQGHGSILLVVSEAYTVDLGETQLLHWGV